MPDNQKHAPPVPQKAIEYLGRKVKVETEKWDELKWGEHAHALTVAHSANAGVLDEIHRLLNNAVEKGIAYQDFRNGMLDMMKQSGWYGGAGHTEDEKKYINWRIGVIYDTNMRTAYAQANYREQLAGAELRPIWVYQSQLTGENRRQEHIELHGRAFRYDDSFWDTHYPPNGWGCECYVNTESDHGAEKGGIKVEDSKDITPPEIDPTWAYNVGREALAPNFNKYTNLPKETLSDIYKKYRNGMNNNTISKGELLALLKRTKEKDFKSLNINYQVGTLEIKRYEALRKKGVDDCKLMTTDSALRHGTADKIEKQKITDENFKDIYELFQEPESIYEAIKENKIYRTFHFVKRLEKGDVLQAVFHTRRLKNVSTALELATLSHLENENYDRKGFEKIW